MKIMLLLSFTPGTGPAPGSPEQDAEFEQWGAVDREMQDAGVYRFSEALEIPEDATEEVIFAVYLIEVADREAAAAWAQRLPHAWYGSTEVRPVMGSGT